MRSNVYIIKSTFQDKNNMDTSDKATDIEGHYISNVFIGSYVVNKSGQIGYLNYEILDKVNYFTISKLFNITLYIW